MHQVANDIELPAFKSMWKLEGVQDVDKEYDKKKNQTRASQPTYLGIGRQLREWKKKSTSSTIPIVKCFSDCK